MIIETITVTTTATSIFDLVETARGDVLGKSDAITEIMFRTDVDGTEPVLIEEGGTVSPATLLDPYNDQPYASFSDFDLKQCFLSVSTGTVDVSIVGSQKGVRS